MKDLLKRLARTTADGLRAVLFPRRCVGCGKLLDEENNAFLCAACTGKWVSASQSACPGCGRNPHACRCVPRAHEGKISCYRYAVPYRSEPVKTILLRMKGKPDTDAVRFLGGQCALLCEAVIAEYGFDREECVITAPPRTRQKRAESGTDQGVALARECAFLTGIPFAELLERTAEGQEQKKLSAGERLENAKSSVCLRHGAERRLYGRHTILVDDILTTGATANACASVLTDAGAADVFCVTAAKTY